MEIILEQFLKDLRGSGMWEWIAVITGIASVWFSKKEHILVYPVGLVNTIIYVVLSFQNHLIGEASVNIFYSVMSVYGWFNWARRNAAHEHIVHVCFSNGRDWKMQLLFFAGCFVVLYYSLLFLKHSFAKEAIPLPDAFASAAAFTGMLLMTKKKVESWYWWIATNIASIPLYFVKHMVLTSVYYLILLILAIFGLLEWIQRAKQQQGR
ncbi:nicotinamide riboside transporter PnuC [Pollutibacter soli]|uniref:nicotinamide riboside transporter PnuC n=1 Tax=Pollutibacter soli TaxID=3034157 RepID=UPI0030140CA5